MALLPGEITSGDISPNAGILGTQIADNTIQLRNLTDDTFRIVQSGTASIIATTNGNSNTATVNHNLGYVPAVLAYTFFNNNYGPLPQFIFGLSTTQFQIEVMIYCSIITSTDITFQLSCGAGGGTNTPTPIKFFLLQEKASIT